MAKENERKFLVIGEYKHLSFKKHEIAQYYFVTDPIRTIRLRIRDSEAFLTIKGKPEKGSISRDEWEYSIPLKDAKDMIKICKTGKILKTRHLIKSGSHIIEVDEFHDKNEGMVIAEIELTVENETFEKPEWLGDEVTGIPLYYNANLIK